MSEILSKLKVKEIINIQIEEAEFKVKRAKSPKSKRDYNSALDFWRSLDFYLNDK